MWLISVVMGNLLIEIAYDENKNIVFANNAVKGKKYFCPECKEELVFKNSGKTGPGSRCPHFAHKGGSTHNCEPESVLHAAFKNETAKFLRSCLAENKSFDIKWTCSNCGYPYSGNLLFIAKSIEVEYNLKVCKPDIALLDDAGKVRIAVEIVNTHKPEENTLAYYKDNGIILVQYNVVKEDFINIENKLKTPDNVSLCTKSSCKAFNIAEIQRDLKAISYICPKCNNQKFALLYVQNTALFTNTDWLEKEDEHMITDNNLEPNLFKYKGIVDPNTGEFVSTFVSYCKCDAVYCLSQRKVK